MYLFFEFPMIDVNSKNTVDTRKYKKGVYLGIFLRKIDRIMYHVKYIKIG